mgnify:CR=1 FL=1
MARKSFKKGVKNVINSIETDKDARKQADGKSTSKKTDTKPQQNRIRLDKSLTVQNADRVKRQLEQALKSKQKVEITSEEISEVDVSVLQILITFDQAATRKKLQVAYELRFSKDMQHLLELSGMSTFVSSFKKD